MNTPCQYLTPPEYAARLGVKPAKVIVWIRAGELVALDTAERGCTRPRYRISPQAIEDFERRRSVGPLPKPIRRRRASAVKEFV